MKMPEESIRPDMFAPCGMNCMVCYRHCYHKKPCAGCLEGDRGKPEHCRACKIKDCIKEKDYLTVSNALNIHAHRLRILREAITGGTRQALWKTAGMFRTMALNPSWKSRRKDIRVSGAKALFPFTTGYAVNARRRWGRACLKIHSRPKACKGKVRGKSEGNKREDNGGT